MSLIRRIILGRRSFCTAMPRKAEDIMKNPDTAARYSRLAVFSRPDDEPEVTSHTCQTIIGRHKDAYDYFFNNHTLKPNSNCCYPLRVPDHVAFKDLIQEFLDFGNLDKAIHLFEVFKRSLSSCIADDKFTWDIISRECRLRYEHHERYEYPEYENRVTFLMATFMEYWFKQGNEVEAMECYNQSVRATKLLLCPETGNALLKVLLKYGQKSHAWALYNDMFAQCTTCLDAVTVRIMVNECFDMGRCSEAMETYYKARAKVNYVSNEYIILRCCENGMLSEADSLLAYSIGPGDEFIQVTTFKTIMNAYIKAGRIDDALKTSNKMFDVTLKELSKRFNPL